MKEYTDDEKKTIQCPQRLHFLAAWTKFDTLYFQIICSKKRKSTDQRETLCHLNNNGNISLNTSFISYGKLSNSTFTCQSYDQLTSFLTIKIFSLTTFSQIREINR